MIAKELEQITELDLQSLKDNAVPEGKTIDYKRKLPGNSDKDKKEFLADVSSFANASGGDLIFGVIESGGMPKSIDGLIIADIDQEKLRLESIIRDSTQPRILVIGIQPIPLSNSRTVLLIRVPKSWNSPHRVIFKGHDKFYSRNSAGKYPMDVAELRLAFNLSETVTQRIRLFREDRISKLAAKETPVPFYDNAKIALHLIPIISMNTIQSYDINRVASNPALMQPIYCHGWNSRYNLDGFLTYSPDQEGNSHSYVQLFRNGIIEAVEALLLEPYEGQKTIPSIAYEQELVKSFTDYLSLLEGLNVELPIIVFLTLLDVKGYVMAISRMSSVRSETVDRDVLLLPETILERYDISAHAVLRPLFDIIWNACGLSKSHNYNDNGEWAPPR